MNRRGIVLIRRLKDGQTWFTLPGGGISPNESAEAALVREFEEETGLQLGCGPRIAVAEERSPHGLAVQMYFWCVPPDEAVRRGHGDEYSPQGGRSRGAYEPVWADPDRLPSQLRPGWLRDLLPGWIGQPPDGREVWHFGPRPDPNSQTSRFF